MEDVVKGHMPTIQGEGELKRSERPQFDPNIVKDGLKDDGQSEGGRYLAVDLSGSNSEKQSGDPNGFYGHGDGQYEVYGFSVSYGDKELAIADVSHKFKTMDDAKNCVSINVYTHTTPSGSKIDCKIVRGAPVICVNERDKMKYVEGAWVAL